MTNENTVIAYVKPIEEIHARYGKAGENAKNKYSPVDLYQIDTFDRIHAHREKEKARKR